MLAHHALGAVAVLGEDQAEHAVVLAVGRLAFPELRTEIEEIVGDGDRPAIRWRSTGRHTGVFLGVPPTGKPVEVAGAVGAGRRGRARSACEGAGGGRPVLVGTGTVGELTLTMPCGTSGAASELVV